MSLKGVWFGVLGALLVAAGAVMAAEYRPDDFLNLDLSTAVPSPTPFGPVSHFALVPVKAKGDGSDRKSDSQTHASQARTAPDRVAIREERSPRISAVRRRGAARARLAHRHGNPLDAQAMVRRTDRRVQVWPCRSGGICGSRWQRRNDIGGVKQPTVIAL